MSRRTEKPALTRSWYTERAITDEGGRVQFLRDGGDEDALQAAQALANLCDAATLRSLVDLVVTLQRFGGEAYVGAYRRKIDPEGRIVLPEEIRETAGTYETVGYLFFWDAVAKQTRAATQVEDEPTADLSEPIPIPPDQGEEPGPVEVDDPEALAAVG